MFRGLGREVAVAVYEQLTGANRWRALTNNRTDGVLVIGQQRDLASQSHARKIEHNRAITWNGHHVATVGQNRDARELRTFGGGDLDRLAGQKKLVVVRHGKHQIVMQYESSLI